MKHGPHALSCEQLEDRLQPAVTYHGGALLPHVEVDSLFMGSKWTTSQGYAKANALDGFLATVVNGPYMDALGNAGYGVGRGTLTGAVILPSQLDPNYYLTDARIQHAIQAGINGRWLQQPDANRLYVVYVEPGIAVWQGGSDSISGFLGYHGAFAGTNAAGNAADIHYGVVPYPGGWNPTARSQGFPTNFTQLTAVTSHEIAEAATDPNADYKRLGWYDDTNNAEIGDLTPNAIATVDGYYVQLVVNRDDSVLYFSGATSPNWWAAPTGGPSGYGFDSIGGTATHHHDRAFANWHWGLYVG